MPPNFDGLCEMVLSPVLCGEVCISQNLPALLSAEKPWRLILPHVELDSSCQGREGEDERAHWQAAWEG